MNLLLPSWANDPLFGSPYTEAGVHVDEYTALTVSAVWGCVQVISESIASLPWRVYKYEGDQRRIDDGNPVDALLYSRPNDEMSAVDFRQTMVTHTLLRGNSYAEIEQDREGTPIALWPIHPSRVMPTRKNDSRRSLVYRVSTSGIDDDMAPSSRLGRDRGTVDLSPHQVFHIRGLSLNGVTGLSVIRYIRESIGMALAAERYGARMFANDARPSVALKYPGELSTTAARNLRESFEELMRGRNQHRPVVLEEGMELETFGIPPEDAQFLQTRQFQVAEICRWFRVPPHMVADLSRATFSNIEHQSLSFVRSTLLPWMRKFESEADYKLIGYSPGSVQRRTRMIADELSQADQKTRYEGHQIALNNGFKSIDEVRAEEGLNPLPDGQGEKYRVPLNLSPTDEADADGDGDDDGGDEPQVQPTETEPDDDHDGDARVSVFVPAVGRTILAIRHRVEAAIASKKSPPAEWLESWLTKYRRSACDQLSRVIEPAAMLHGKSADDSDAVARQWFDGFALRCMADYDAAPIGDDEAAGIIGEITRATEGDDA